MISMIWIFMLYFNKSILSAKTKPNDFQILIDFIKCKKEVEENTNQSNLKLMEK